MIRNPLFLLGLCSFCVATALAQPLPKAAKDAFLISRMANKFHVQPRPLDDALSANLYAVLLESLDDQRIFFTQEDIARFAPWQLKLDDEVGTRQTAFLQLLLTTYKLRLQQADTMVDNICKTPYNFSLKEKLTIAEDTAYPSGVAGMRTKLYKLMKGAVLDALVDYAAITNPAKVPSKKYVDSLEPVLRKKAQASFKRSIRRTLQNPIGIETAMANLWCSSLAACYDPHTMYFPPATKESFEGQLGKKQLEFGLTLAEDKDGNAQIGALKPGSPAFQSGQLNEGDKIQSVQTDNKAAVDVSTAGAAEINQVLAAAGSGKTVLTVKKADGSTRQVTLSKQKQLTDDEEDKVKGFVLKGSKNIGYISLPAFYLDWEEEQGINGCANDVGREIIKLKKENISGLILDLRYNGGGSLQEALELAGIFIDAGPVAQIKSRDPKVQTLKDINRGTVYDGPLLVLINGFSASASEMLAASLQDYNRALIVGAASYGKATAQEVLPLDTTINLETYNGKAASDGYIKLTISCLYRLTGATAQAQGVIPHIVLPDMADALSEKEANERNVLRPAAIEGNKYYKPLAALPVANAAAIASQALEASPYFKELRAYIDQEKKKAALKDATLQLEEAWQEHKATLQQGSTTPPEPGKEGSTGFVVDNHAYARQRLQADRELREVNEARKENILADPYIKIAWQLLAGIK
jgi:carboxyl-terminal processing protease